MLQSYCRALLHPYRVVKHSLSTTCAVSHGFHQSCGLVIMELTGGCSVQATLEQTAAAMRFFLASLTQYQSPLTEEDFVVRIQEWATTDIEKALARYQHLSLACTFGCA